MRAVVTGGGGFLGGRITALLRARGDEVCVLARRSFREADALGATGIPVDVRDTEAVGSALAGADIVFHVAARTGYWDPVGESWSVNLEGTRSVLDAVRRTGVRKLVFTSTPSVVGFAEDVENGGPDLPYAAVHQSTYSASKAAAERLVLAANGNGVATVALRPHLLIGPGDRHLMPRVVQRAARGRLRIIGDGHNRVDLTYVDNAAWAHLDAADALTGAEARCAGKSYFITNGEPVLLWDWLNQLLADLGLAAVTRSISLPMAQVMGAAMESLWRTLRLDGEPPITRFLANALARSHWYDLEPARQDLGYRVRVPMAEATRRTAEWLSRAVLESR